MQPHEIAAHNIARHLRAIAVLFPQLTEEQKAIYLPGWGQGEGDITADLTAMWKTKADQIEATAPFEKLTEAERELVADNVRDQLEDMSTRERVREHVGDWTDADWRMEYDEMVGA